MFTAFTRVVRAFVRVATNPKVVAVVKVVVAVATDRRVVAHAKGLFVAFIDSVSDAMLGRQPQAEAA
jgi:hypothetical protein